MCLILNNTRRMTNHSAGRTPNGSAICYQIAAIDIVNVEGRVRHTIITSYIDLLIVYSLWTANVPLQVYGYK